MGTLEIKDRLETCNETRLNGFHITFQNFNGTEQANITEAISDWINTVSHTCAYPFASAENVCWKRLPVQRGSATNFMSS